MSDIPTDPNEAKNRALLQAMAQNGVAGKAAFNSQVATAPPTPQQQAVQSAYDRGAQIGAPLELINQQQGDLNGAYNQAAQSRAKASSLAGGVRGAYNSSASTYENQLALATPVVEARTNIAVEQALAEAASRKSDQGYRDRSLALDSRKLALEEKKVSAAEKEALVPGASEPRSSADAAKFANIPPAKAKAISQSESYNQARNLLLDAAGQGLPAEEIDALVRGRLQRPDPTTGLYLDGTTTPPDSAVADLLLATYAPSLASGDKITKSVNYGQGGHSEKLARNPTGKGTGSRAASRIAPKLSPADAKIFAKMVADANLNAEKEVARAKEHKRF